MTKLEEENRGWTEEEAKDFIKEVERLKELWYPRVINAPEVSTRASLVNLREIYDSAYLRIERESEQRREENERRKQERLRNIKEENKNLEWPKSPALALLNVRKPFDYWRDGCLYCSRYKPQTKHDYEVHIVTRHAGKPAYPGPADTEKYGLKLNNNSGNGKEESETQVKKATASNQYGNHVCETNLNE